MTKSEIGKAGARDYRAWAAQRAAYGLTLDDDAYASWHEALEAQERDRLRALMAS